MKVSRQLLAQLHQHLEAGYPNEACGVMLGKDGVVTDVVAATNERIDSAHNRYLIDPLAYSKIERQADTAGLRVLGIYHSHPEAAAQPSRFDLENAWPNLLYVIVSVTEGKAVETTAWQLREDSRQFEPVAVEVV